MLRVICSQCGDLFETTSRKQAERVGIMHYCDGGDIEIEELVEPPEERDWTKLAIGAVVLFVAFLILTFFITLRLSAQTAPRALVVWDKIPEPYIVEGYRVKRGTAADNLSVIEAHVDPSANAWTDTTVEPTTRYFYAVQGFNSTVGDGTLSEVIPFRFSDIQPASPTNVSVAKSTSAGRTTLAVSWSPVVKARSGLAIAGGDMTYNVFITNSGTIARYPITTNSLTVSGFKKNLTLYVYAFAVWNGIESLGSPAVRVQT